MIWRTLPRSGCVYGSRGRASPPLPPRAHDPVRFLPHLFHASCPFAPPLQDCPLRMADGVDVPNIWPFQMLLAHHDLSVPWRERGPKIGKVPGGPCSSLPLSPFYSVKMHVPKSRRTSRDSGSDSRSRSPLSIRALRSARNDRIRLRAINF